MARFSEIELLANRRRLLLAESDRLRRQLGAEIDQLQAATDWIKTGYSLLQFVRSYWPLVVAGAGFLLTRQRRSPLSVLERIGSVWRIAERLFHLWQQYSTESAPPEKERRPSPGS